MSSKKPQKSEGQVVIDTQVFTVQVRDRPDFDIACRLADQLALTIWGIDDSGYSSRYPKVPRSSSYIAVEFVRYKRTISMGGGNHDYVFETKLVEILE